MKKTPIPQSMMAPASGTDVIIPKENKTAPNTAIVPAIA